MENEKIINNDTNNLFVLIGDNKFEESEKLALEPYSYWKSVLREFFKKKSAIFALVTLIILVLLAIFAPMFSDFDVYNVSTSTKYITPNSTYWFGTDSAGRDIWTLIWTGARLSLILAVVVTLINTLVGVFIGGVWGYFRKFDPIMLEIYNFLTNIPVMLIYIIMLFVLDALDTSPIFNMIVALTVTGWASLARLVRNQVVVYNNRENNIASRTLGSKPRRIIVNNLLPYILSVIITNVSITISGVIATEVTLAYFGVGLPISTISLGRILRESYNGWIDNPHILFFPALVVIMISIAFYLIGVSLADALDPRTHR